MSFRIHDIVSQFFGEEHWPGYPNSKIASSIFVWILHVVSRDTGCLPEAAICISIGVFDDLNVYSWIHSTGGV